MRHRRLQLVNAYFFFVGLLLMATAFAKAISAAGNSMALRSEEPIFRLAFQELFILAAVVEMSVGVICLMWRSNVGRAAIVIWLSVVFIGYRLGLLWLRYPGPCPCLGSMTEILHVNQAVAELGLKLLIVIMLAGSGCILLFRQRLSEIVTRS